METTISLERLWQTIRTLPLDNRKWLQSKLQTSIRDEEAAAAPCQYTPEELGQRLSDSVESYRKGRYCTSDELRK